MEIGINPGYLAKTRRGDRKRTVDERVKLCVDAGFRVLDCSIDAWSEDWEAQADEIMRFIDFSTIDERMRNQKEQKRIIYDWFQEETVRIIRPDAPDGE